MVNEAVRDIEMSRGRSETELSPRSFARSDKRSQNTFGDSQSAFADKIDPAAEKYYGLTPYNSMANNPFTFNDPEGDDFGLTLITAVTIGLLANGINNVNHGANFFDNWVETVFWSSFAAVGAYGIGGAFGGLGTLGTEAARAGTHAAFSGLVSHWQGGEFWHGAVAGGVGSGVGSGIHAGANKLGWSQQGTNVAMVGGGAISGGFGASISGGDFWHGFGTAATTGLMNHVLHNRGGTDPWEVIRSETHELGGRTDYFEDGSSAFYSSGGAVQFYNADGSLGPFYMAGGQLSSTMAPHEYLMGGGLSVIGAIGVRSAFIASLRSYVGNYATLHPRVANDIYRGSRVNAGKRGATFMRSEISKFGNIAVRNWRTISFSYTTQGGQRFSLGFNPWTRRIFHLSPGN